MVDLRGQLESLQGGPVPASRKRHAICLDQIPADWIRQAVAAGVALDNEHDIIPTEDAYDEDDASSCWSGDSSWTFRPSGSGSQSTVVFPSEADSTRTAISSAPARKTDAQKYATLVRGVGKYAPGQRGALPASLIRRSIASSRGLESDVASAVISVYRGPRVRARGASQANVLDALRAEAAMHFQLHACDEDGAAPSGVICPRRGCRDFLRTVNALTHHLHLHDIDLKRPSLARRLRPRNFACKQCGCTYETKRENSMHACHSALRAMSSRSPIQAGLHILKQSLAGGNL